MLEQTCKCRKDLVVGLVHLLSEFVNVSEETLEGEFEDAYSVEQAAIGFAIECFVRLYDSTMLDDDKTYTCDYYIQRAGEIIKENA